MTQHSIKIEGFVPGPQSQRDMVTLSFKLHTIILLVGPDCAGKTCFVMEQLMPQLKMAQIGLKKIIIADVELDQIAKGLLDNPFANKNDREFIQIAEQSQDILFSHVKNFASYPVNADFIIIDSTGLDPDFRTEILRIAEENNYNVSALIFDFNNKKEYCKTNESHSVIREASPKQLKDLRRTLSGGLSKKDYESVQTIVSKDFFQYEIVIENYSSYDQFILPEGPEYVIIGDIHGCLDEFIALLKLNGFEIGEDQRVSHPEGKKVVLIGDLIDKGYAIKEVIEFVYVNRDVFYMVIGNHENFVVKALRGIIKNHDRPSNVVVDEYFNTYIMLNEPVSPKEPKEPVKPEGEELKQKYEKASAAYSIHRKDGDEPVLNYERFTSRLMENYEKSFANYLADKKEYEELLREYNVFLNLTQEARDERKAVKEKLLAIYDSMKAFFIHRDFIVTHAPTEKIYLGKISPESLRASRDFRYPKQRDYAFFDEFRLAFDERTAFLKVEARDLHPIHVYGHVMTKEVSRLKNKLAIDTGCVAGGKLSSVIIRGSKVEIKSVSVIDESKVHKAELYNFFEQVRSESIIDN